jgi:hypothetical protein
MSKRNHAAYAQATIRVYEDFCIKQEELMEDYLDSLYQRYPFKHEQNSNESLAYIVMRQLKYVLYKLKDLNHAALVGMEKNNIDWLAEPYFRGQTVQLSTLLHEYDYFYSNPTYNPSCTCHAIFRISVQEPAAPSPRSEWDQSDTEAKKARVE